MLLGLLALGLLATAGGIVATGHSGDYTLVMSVCLRMGLVLAALWLAFDQLEALIRSTPPWMMGCAALCLLVVVIRPRAIVAVAPLLAAAAALHYFGRFLKPPSDAK